MFVCCGQISHHVDDRVGIVNLIVKVLYLDLAMCLRQLGNPCLLCGVGDIGCDEKPLNLVLESDAVRGRLRDGG